MRRRIYLAGIAALSMAAAATGEPLDGLEFLVGTWSAGASDFQGTDVFQLDLVGRILQRHSRSTVPAASGHYDHITVISGREIEFRSDGSPSKPEFRLTYSLTAPGTLHVKFELRPPGQSAYSTLAEADESLKH